MNYEKLTVNELFNEYEHLGIQKMKLIQKMNRMKHSKQLFQPKKNRATHTIII